MERRVGPREWNEALNEDRYSFRNRIEREQWSFMRSMIMNGLPSGSWLFSNR